MAQKGSPQLMYGLNRSIILQCIREHGTISRSQISRLTGISMPTVTNIVDKLASEEVVKETGKGKSTGGRRPTLVRYNLDYGRVIGVDLGSEKVKIAVADLAGHIITLREKSVWSWDDRSKLEKVIEGIKEVLQEIPNYDPLRSTLGVGVPGVVDSKSGSVSFAPLFPSWDNYPLREILETELKIPTYLDNDVYAAAWGEYSFGAAKEAKSSLFVLVSRGIGSGLITDGKIYRGATGAAGEIGYTLVDRSNLHMNFGEKGCLESLCSTSAMASKAKEAVKRGESPLLKQLCNDDIDALTPEIVCQAAIQNDPVASAIVEESREYLAVAIANAVSIVNPEMIVLGGDLAGLPDVEELFVEPIRALIKSHVPHFPTITLSSLTTNAVIYGAIVFALDLIQERLVGTAI